MVDTNEISNAITTLESFFKEVQECSQNEGDIERAEYGLLKVKFLWNVLKKYDQNPQNKLLKQLDAGFVSVTRGVEFFTDYQTNKKFYNLFKEISDIKSNIKW